MTPHKPRVTETVQSVKQLAMGWTVCGSKHSRDKLSTPIQTEPETNPPICTMDTGSPSLAESGQGVALNTHPHQGVGLKKEQSYISTPPLGLLGQ